MRKHLVDILLLRDYMNFKYLNMMKYKTYDEYNKIQWKWGFDTTAKTKGIAVQDAVSGSTKG